MDKLNEKLRAAIRENLPESLAGELKDYLQDHESLKAEGHELRSDIDRLRAELADAQQSSKDTIAEITKLKAGIEELEAYRARERDWKVEIAELKQQAAESKCAAIHALAETAFRNPRLIHSQEVSVSKSHLDQYGSERTLFDTTTTTTTSEETKAP